MYKVRISFELATNSLRITDLLTNNKFFISTLDFLTILQSIYTKHQSFNVEYIARYLFLAGINLTRLSPIIANRCKKWEANGWSLSLIYHLSCHQIHPEDYFDSLGNIRTEILKEYSNTKEFPMQENAKDEGISLDSDLGQDLPDKTVLRALLSRKTYRYFNNKTSSFQLFCSTISKATLKIKKNLQLIQEHKTNKLNLLKSYGTSFNFYIVIYNVENINNGIYFYDIINNNLRSRKIGNFRQEMFEILWKQSAPLTANWSIVLVLDFESYQWRYKHERALRNLFIESGRIFQEFIISGHQNSIGSFTTPGINDERLSNLLELDLSEKYPVYTLTQGVL
jgi:SagB-type dehydrogenase family enzyme